MHNLLAVTLALPAGSWAIIAAYASASALALALVPLVLNHWRYRRDVKRRLNAAPAVTVITPGEVQGLPHILAHAVIEDSRKESR